MKTTLLIILTCIASLILCGCPAQTQIYHTGYLTKKDGTKVAVPVLAASFGQDIDGDVSYHDGQTLLTVSVDPQWAGKFYTVNKYDAKGVLIESAQKPVLARMSSSKVVKSWLGEKGAPGVIDSAGNIGVKAVGASVLPAIAAPFAAISK